MKNYYFSIVAFLMLAFSSPGMAQADQKAEKNVEQMLNERRFTFIAQTAMPTRGATIQLTSTYDLVFAGDSLRSYLPYFGRAYTAPTPGELPLQFNSQQYEYKLDPRKRGGWNIAIKPKDIQGVQQMTLLVHSSGTATLRVVSTNRDLISFNGYVRENKL